MRAQVLLEEYGGFALEDDELVALMKQVNSRLIGRIEKRKFAVLLRRTTPRQPRSRLE